MPTIDITRPELIWPGKYDEYGLLLFESEQETTVKK
jgi:hypothetical protein